MTARTALVDSHAHLDFPEFAGELDAVLSRAREADVVRILTVGTHYEAALAAIDLARRYDSVSAAAGVHPSYVAERFPEFGDLCRLFDSEPLVAVGETGLDFYRKHTPPDMQVDAFRKHIDLALSKDLPLIIHVRDAYDEVLAVLDSVGEMPRGVFHCFSGDTAFAREVLERGFFVSVAGQVTFKNAKALRETVATLPLGRLLVETDCPYLAPVPRRGRTNEPAFVRYTAEEVARCLDVPLSDLARATTVNAWRLFRIGPEPPRGVIAYAMRGNLYLNITNRCGNRCPWCVRFRSPYLAGYNLALEREPTAEEVIAAAGDVSIYDEVVFCGYGEPTARLDVVKKVGAHLRALGRRVRLDTNGLGSLEAGRDITVELTEAVDAVSVSLNSADPDEYTRVCEPSAGPAAHAAAVDFVKRASRVIADVTVTAVDLPGVDIGAVKELAARLGVGFRLRHMGPYG